MVQEIRQLYAFNRWANGRIHEVVSRLTADRYTRDLGSSFASVHDTLLHILAAEWVWLFRWQEIPPPDLPGAWELRTLNDLREKWSDLEHRQEAFLSGLSEDDLHQIIEYHSADGESYARLLWQTLLHVVNHSSYHRGQVVTMLRQLGAEVVGTDLTLFFPQQMTEMDR